MTSDCLTDKTKISSEIQKTYFFHPEFCLQGRKAMQAKFRAKIEFLKWLFVPGEPSFINQIQNQTHLCRYCATLSACQLSLPSATQCGLKRALQARSTRHLNHLRF